MISLVFKTLFTGLSLWKSKESRKYLDELISLKKAWYEEYNSEIVDDNVLDSIERKLRILGEAFVNKAGTSDSTNK